MKYTRLFTSKTPGIWYSKLCCALRMQWSKITLLIGITLFIAAKPYTTVTSYRSCLIDLGSAYRMFVCPKSAYWTLPNQSWAHFKLVNVFILFKKKSVYWSSFYHVQIKSMPHCWAFKNKKYTLTVYILTTIYLRIKILITIRNCF